MGRGEEWRGGAEQWRRTGVGGWKVAAKRSVAPPDEPRRKTAPLRDGAPPKMVFLLFLL